MGSISWASLVLIPMWLFSPLVSKLHQGVGGYLVPKASLACSRYSVSASVD